MECVPVSPEKEIVLVMHGQILKRHLDQRKDTLWLGPEGKNILRAHKLK